MNMNGYLSKEFSTNEQFEAARACNPALSLSLVQAIRRMSDAQIEASRMAAPMASLVNMRACSRLSDDQLSESFRSVSDDDRSLLAQGYPHVDARLKKIGIADDDLPNQFEIPQTRAAFYSPNAGRVDRIKSRAAQVNLDAPDLSDDVLDKVSAASKAAFIERSGDYKRISVLGAQRNRGVKL